MYDWIERNFISLSVVLSVFCFGSIAVAQNAVPLTPDELSLVNVMASEVEFKGRSAVRLESTLPPRTMSRTGGGPATGNPTPGSANSGRESSESRARNNAAGARPARVRQESLALVNEIEFNNGVIELELAGRPKKDAGANARGFIGLAFHVKPTNPIRYDCFYLRPTNGRADDQLRRNHTCQYMSHPDFPFSVLRRESPGVYESYVDIAPGEWISVKIVVDGESAKLYVNDADQPCLIVKDLKRADAGGQIALWMERSTDAYFRNLVITPK